MARFWLTLWLLTGLTGLAIAEDFDALFDDDAFADVEVRTQPAESHWHWQNRLDWQAIYNTRRDGESDAERAYSGWSANRFYWQPRLSWQPATGVGWTGEARLGWDSIFTLRDNAPWHPDDRDAREWTAELREFRFWLPLGPGSLSYGVQTETLGLLDGLSVLNVLNAQDRTVPGLASPDDAALPNRSAIYSTALADYRVRTGMVQLFYPDRLPPVGSDFNPGGQSPRLVKPGEADLGAYLAMSRASGPWDWQFLIASSFDSSGYLTVNEGELERRFSRVNRAGAAVSRVQGIAIWKAEMALVHNLEAAALMPGPQGPVPHGAHRYHQWQSALGAEWNLGQANLVAEVRHNQTFQQDGELELAGVTESSQQWLLAMRSRHWRERLELNARVFGQGFDADSGVIAGVGIAYDWRDGMTSELNWLTYREGNLPPLQQASGNDRLVLSSRWTW